MTGIESISVLDIIIFVWLMAITFLLFRALKHYQALTKGVAQKDLISALNNLVSKVGEAQDLTSSTKQELERFRKDSEVHLQRLGFKRFNPFTDTGGNQSFILSLLDENGSGVVISSLHSRENTRVYAKQISKGLCPDQVLSKEEQSVIKESLK